LKFQREKEYSEARMRILGDVRFLAEEKEAELESTMSPAEILKMKINKSMMNDAVVPNSTGEEVIAESTAQQDELETTGESAPVSKSRNKRRSKAARANQNVTPPLHFPPSKIDSERIHRQPRGPDGTTGFSPLPR
jgi:hypothetical protein